ncbi:MAG: hypothetical protein GX027_06100 [Clostridiaceae bacterium]|nr:hypothetical protein [Clostridiaceae bacterium]
MMKGFPCPDIDTGWKPVIHEDGQIAPTDGPSIQCGLDVGSHTGHGTLMADVQTREILRILREIQHEMVSIKQMLKGMEVSCPEAKGRKLRPRKKRLIKKLATWGEVDHVRIG